MLWWFYFAHGTSIHQELHICCFQSERDNQIVSPSWYSLSLPPRSIFVIWHSPPVALLLELYYASVFYIFFFVVLKLALNNLLQGCFSSSGFLAGLGSDIDFGLIRFDQPVCWAATVSISQGGRVHYWHEEDYTLWEVGQNISFNDKETSYASSSGLGRNAMIHYMYALRSSSYLSHKILNGGNNDNHKLNETDLGKDR